MRNRDPGPGPRRPEQGPRLAGRTRPYLYHYDVAIAICSNCFRRIEARIVFEDGSVWMLKHCPEHGPERMLISNDAAYCRTCPIGCEGSGPLRTGHRIAG